MPRTETVLQAFVASPGDVGDERTVLEDIVRELNLAWSRTLGLRVELVKWETHAFPATGEDAQQIINKQIGDDYDIFIGIMWAHFGSPTGRFGSGTEEEFERAFARWQKNPDSVHVMFYFKDAGLQPSQIDLKQFSSVIAFREKLGPKGTLYWTYTSKEEFTQLLRLHLSRVVQNWRKGAGLVASKALEVVQSATPVAFEELEVSHQPEEIGFLDAILISQDRFQELTAILNRMEDAIKDVGGKFNERTKDMESLRIGNKIVDVRAALRISNRTAADIDEFAARMEAELPLFSKVSRVAVESMTQAVNLFGDFQRKDDNEIKDALQAVEALLEGMRQMQEGNAGFIEIIAKLPRVTSAFQKARQRAVSILKKLDQEINATKSLTLELGKLLREMLGHA